MLNKFFMFSETEALGIYKDTIQKINSRLPMLFGPEVLNQEILDVEVKPVPPLETGLAYYWWVMRPILLTKKFWHCKDKL